jgi:hypothetical protein
LYLTIPGPLAPPFPVPLLLPLLPVVLLHVFDSVRTDVTRSRVLVAV